MISLTAGMIAVISHFEAVGARWGVRRETCRVHALLYLVGQPLEPSEIAEALGIDTQAADEAVADLLEWRLATRTRGGVRTGAQPWDMLMSAIEERQRREVEPARRALDAAIRQAVTDGTPPAVIERIRGLADLVQDLAAIASQLRRLPPRAMSSLILLGGRAARLFGSTR